MGFFWCVVSITIFFFDNKSPKVCGTVQPRCILRWRFLLKNSVLLLYKTPLSRSCQLIGKAIPSFSVVAVYPRIYMRTCQTLGFTDLDKLLLKTTQNQTSTRVPRYVCLDIVFESFFIFTADVRTLSRMQPCYYLRMTLKPPHATYPDDSLSRALWEMCQWLGRIISTCYFFRCFKKLVQCVSKRTEKCEMLCFTFVRRFADLSWCF